MISLSQSKSLYSKSQYRLISMTHKAPSFISSKEDIDENFIHSFSQKPKRYQGNIILSVIQLSQNTHNKKNLDKKIKKNYQGWPPSNSSEEQRILKQIQKYTILYNIHLQKLQNLQRLQSINKLNQQCHKLTSRIYDALMEEKIQLINLLSIQRDKVEQKLNQQKKQELHSLNQLHQLAKKLQQLQKELQKQRQRHKIFPIIK